MTTYRMVYNCASDYKVWNNEKRGGRNSDMDNIQKMTHNHSNYEGKRRIMSQMCFFYLSTCLGQNMI